MTAAFAGAADNRSKTIVITIVVLLVVLALVFGVISSLKMGLAIE